MTRNARHNAHMLIPKDLYERARELAALEGSNVTELVCQGLELVLAKAKKRKRKP